MTRASHYIIGLSAAASLVGFLPSPVTMLVAAGIVGGANLPDDLELPRRPDEWGNARPPVIPHRTITHWPWSYVIIMLGCAALVRSPYADLVLGLALGALVHLLCDSASPHGIPWLTPFRSLRPSMTVYTSRRASEMYLVLPMVAIAAVSLWHGYPAIPTSATGAISALLAPVFPWHSSVLSAWH